MDFDSVTFFLDDLGFWSHWFQSVLGLTLKPTHPKPSPQASTSTPALSLHTVQQYLEDHPPGIADVGFRVNDIEQTHRQAIEAGATVIQPITPRQLGHTVVKQAVVSGWGHLRHTLTEYSPASRAHRLSSVAFYLAASCVSSPSALMSEPGSINVPTVAFSLPPEQIPNLVGIDHAVLNVASGDMLKAAAWYERAFGFRCQQTFSIQTPRSGLHSIVMAHPEGDATIPINEPSSSNSQIQEFLEVNRGSGIQHLALSTGNIVQTVARLQNQGVRFLSVPESYYEQLPTRPGFQGSMADDWGAIAQHGILVDWKTDIPNSLLFQIFTEPIFQEPTFFFEIIQRHAQVIPTPKQGTKGFGEGNFRALFEAIEREQLKRGHL
jgi:4-hydroxyphenylpyruvate dioxygenase